MNKIIFHSNRIYNKKNDEVNPSPVKQNFPYWFKEASKFFKKDNSNEIYQNHMGGNVLSFKSCPALLDSFESGYFLKTPCNLFFYKKNNKLCVSTDKGYEDFCAPRDKMPGFSVPHGYLEDHFHWYPNWAPELPDGYSALYLSPINRFDLPFITTSGIIDNDKMNTPGLIPFFVKDNFEGVIPKGTPYVQIIPYKREHWESEMVFYSNSEIYNRHQAQADFFRTKNGGEYKKRIWTRKEYK